MFPSSCLRSRTWFEGMTMWTLHDAKNRFCSVVDAAMAGAPQDVSRRGRPAVVVISAEAAPRDVTR